MKQILHLTTLVYLISSSAAFFAQSGMPGVTYEINVLNYEDDLFHVTVFTEGLGKENNIYNLPATVPGTYSNLNFGRFVTSFNAYDKDGTELPTEKISINCWKISYPDKLHRIDYDVEDTFDAEVEREYVIPMAGTGISDKFIVLNTFATLGYFEGLQTIPVKLKLFYPKDWKIGTSLPLIDNYYTAESYDYLVDSPFLLGELTTAGTTVNGIKVGVYVYSPDTLYSAEKILKAAEEILQSSSEFIGYAPVSNYNFLMCFLDMKSFMEVGFAGAGALEHSYSSLFVFPAAKGMFQEVQDDIAHEFLHILSPLNLHSDVLQPFNFEVPTASQHTWLYEGVTEWASDIMQLRGGIISVDEYLKRLSKKLTTNEKFKQDISLTELSKQVYDEVITMQFINFYNKGAATAAMLDIRLLELSGGKKGLREFYLELLNLYGKDNPFPEYEFFNIFIDMTYPEIGQFIDDYIKGIQPLPFDEYMTKLGFNYIEERPSQDTSPSLGVQMGMNDKQQFIVVGLSDVCLEAGLKEGDVPVKVMETVVSMETAKQIFTSINQMKTGNIVDITVQRGEEEVVIRVPLQQKMDRHIFEEMENPTEDQLKLRETWLKNL
ncbi:MAG: peptidase [bacterium]|nr:peptidase [bacterium]